MKLVRARGRRGSAGQALPETVIMLSVLLAVVIGAVDVGRVVWAASNLAHAAREGARLAIVHGGSPANPCPVGPPAPGAVIPPASSACRYPSPSKQMVVERTREHILGSLSDIVITVCYGVDCQGNVDRGDNAPGSEVTVVAQGSVDIVAARLLGLGSFDLSAPASMTISR